jgi:ornithine cyclodeaminase
MRDIKLIDSLKINNIFEQNLFLGKEAVLKALELHYRHFDSFVQPIKQYVQRNAEAHTADRIIAMPIYINKNPSIAGIKWIGSHHDNHQYNMNRANAIIILNDTKTNAPIAILDGSMISSIRTFSMSVIGIDRLRPSPKTIACIGMGKLGRLHAALLPQIYPSIERIFCFSNNASFQDITSRTVLHCATYQEAIDQAEVVITTTAAGNPYISASDIKGNKLLINLSLMDFKLEVYLDADAIVVDDWDQCTQAKKIFKQGVDQGLIKKQSV